MHKKWIFVINILLFIWFVLHYFWVCFVTFILWFSYLCHALVNCFFLFFFSFFYSFCFNILVSYIGLWKVFTSRLINDDDDPLPLLWKIYLCNRERIATGYMNIEQICRFQAVNGFKFFLPSSCSFCLFLFRFSYLQYIRLRWCLFVMRAWYRVQSQTDTLARTHFYEFVNISQIHQATSNVFVRCNTMYNINSADMMPSNPIKAICESSR